MSPVVEADQGRDEEHSGQHQVVWPGEGNLWVIHDLCLEDLDLEDFWYVLIKGSRLWSHLKDIQAQAKLTLVLDN